MSEIPFENTGKTMRFIGGQMIPPGETRMVDTREVPGFVMPVDDTEDDQGPDTGEIIRTILGHNIPALKEVLPGLSNDELDLVETGEQAKDSPRQGALAAIAEERIRRAAAEINPPNDPELDAYAASLASMDDDELAEQDGNGNQSVQAAIDAERLTRQIELFKREFSQFDTEDLEELKATYADQPEYLAAIDELIAAKDSV